MSIDDRLIELSIDLPSPMNTAKLPFQLAKIDGTTMFLAGHVPTDQNGNVAKPLGKVGDEVAPEEAYQIARQAALGLLATIKQTLGGLDRVASWLHLFGMVNVAPGFNAIPPVINGASDLILEVFGQQGLDMLYLPNQKMISYRPICLTSQLEDVLHMVFRI